MNTLTKRAYILLVIIVAFLVGLVILAASFAINGGEWATSRANGHLFSGGQITSAGQILDRNGMVLAKSENGERKYNSSKSIRMSTLHAVGDTYGCIATGAHTICRDKLTGYSLVDGIYKIISDGTGSDVKLTIDANICATAYSAMNGKKGTVGVYNYKTGEIVCMMSSPTYDPQNKPSDILTNKKYEGVYINRLLSGVFTPGSTFKVVTSICALDNIPDIQNRSFTCTGAYKTAQGGEVICNNTHGKISFGTALTKSCNSAFAQIGIELGAKKLTATTTALGFNQRYNVSGVNTASSKFSLDKAVEIDVGWASIGQYQTLANPLHMMMIAGSIANGGSTVTPFFVYDTVSNTIGSLKTNKFVSETTAATMRTMMRNNVLNNYGDKRFPNMDFCGKTGTAEVAGETSHAWFLGFSANENFPYAIVVTVQNGGGGSAVAVPIASTVMKALQKSLS